MKYWLIVFFFTPQGEFIDKMEYGNIKSYEACITKAGEMAKTLVNTNNPAQFFCVSDDHHSGRSPDPAVPLDFLD